MLFSTFLTALTVLHNAQAVFLWSNNIFFDVYTRQEDKPTRVENIGDLWNSHINPRKPNIFVIHGWKMNSNNKELLQIAEVARAKYDVNVFVVDYKMYSLNTYLGAIRKLHQVAQDIATFINNIQICYQLDGKNFHLIGFSLGAHVAGYVGLMVNKQLDRITGLDPAGPHFTSSNGLNSSAARYVDVIHTSAGRLGLDENVGHADFYVNGGLHQPHSGFDFLRGDHFTSVVYMAESIDPNTKFLATKCDNWNNYIYGKCTNNHVTLMGQLVRTDEPHGVFFLETGKSPPYDIVGYNVKSKSVEWKSITFLFFKKLGKILSFHANLLFKICDLLGHWSN